MTTLLTNGTDRFALLSSREAQVVKLLMQGRTVGEIAEELRIAHSTADNQKSRAYRKLQVHSNVELVLLGVEAQLVVPSWQQPAEGAR